MRLPDKVNTGWISTPSRSSGTRKKVRPLCLGTSWFVRVSNSTQVASSGVAGEGSGAKIFALDMGDPVPIVDLARAEPESGSE